MEVRSGAKSRSKKEELAEGNEIDKVGSGGMWKCPRKSNEKIKMGGKKENIFGE